MTVGVHVGTTRKVVPYMNVDIHVQNDFPPCSHLPTRDHLTLYPNGDRLNGPYLCHPDS
jgi:hypothetical protein